MNPGGDPLDQGLNSNNQRRMDKRKNKNNANRNTLVVENIPRELNDVAKISEHFSKFGKLRNIKIIENKKKCIIEFANNEQANKAFRSSEAIMGNRFIKIFWNKENHQKNDQNRINNPFPSHKNTDEFSNFNNINNFNNPQINFEGNSVDPYLAGSTDNYVDPSSIVYPSHSSTFQPNLHLQNTEATSSSASTPSAPSEEQKMKNSLNLVDKFLKMADEEKDPKKKEYLMNTAKEMLSKSESQKKAPSEQQNAPIKKKTNILPKNRIMKIDNRSSCIKIENLPTILSRQGNLFQHFKNFGMIEKVWIEDSAGFVKFYTRGEAEYAFRNGCYSISGDQLQFSWYDESKDEKDKESNHNQEGDEEQQKEENRNDSQNENNIQEEGNEDKNDEQENI